MKNNINENISNTLQHFLKNYKKNYFIIGGHAAAYNLKLQGLSFRTTRDYDIVIVSEVENEEFAKALTDLLESGNYQFSYKASNSKRVAYRFENPSNDEFPEVIEFFIKEDAFVQSLDNRFAKLDICVNDDKISAMVLNKEIYDFAKRHVIEINNLMFVDKKALIGLKAYAYFENLKLYKENKVDSYDYEKHKKDILRILGSFTESELTPIDDLPDILIDSTKNIIDVLISSKQQIKTYGLDKNDVIKIMRSILPIQYL